MKNKVIIVGGGPAGLFCAWLLLKKNFSVDLYDQSTGLAKKFLIAGNGGLNLTHSEDLPTFAGRYGKDEKLFSELINEFTPADLRAFCSELGVETFVGSSGRVFPKNLKAAQILLNWSKALKNHPNFNLFLKHRLTNLTKEKELLFENPEREMKVKADVVILGLGGASWKKTGSDGKWKDFLSKLGVEIAEFKPMNCGFERSWSDHFQEIDRAPLKNAGISFKGRFIRGEVMLTPYGMEGGGVYALSNHIRDEIERSGSAQIILDLKPDLSMREVLQKLKNKRAKDSLSNHLRKALSFGKAENALLRELLSKEEFQDAAILASRIKSLEIDLECPRPLDEAISTSGGVVFQALDEHFQIKSLPGVFVAGEMLDFEAPTGGYLLQGCFSTAHRVVRGIELLK